MEIEKVNPSKLVDEFIASGISIVNNSNNLKYENGIARSHIGTLSADFAKGTDMELVQQIINTHDPTPSLEPLTENEMIMLAIADLAEIVLGGIE